MKKTRKEDCALWNKQTTVPHCALEEKAQKELERDGKCGTYDCPFFKLTKEEIRRIEPTLEEKVEALAELLRQKNEEDAIKLIEDITNEKWV